MTRVRMDWGTLTMSVSGHADAGEAGKDIVCAGISTLTNALMQTLEIAKDRGRTKVWIETEGEKWTDENGDEHIFPTGGRIRVRAEPGMGNRLEIKSYFRMCITGLKMIEKEYRKYIDVREVGI